MSESADRSEVRRMSDLMKVALGEAEADLAIVNGAIVNVYTGEVMAGETVLVKGGRIAYVGKNTGPSIGASTGVIDASGKTLIPGLIDGHTHLNFISPIHEVAKYAILGGTTTIITEAIDFATVLGYEGVLDFLASFKDQPVKFFLAVPPMFSLSPLSSGNTLTVSKLRRLLRRREVVSLGETYWLPVLQGDPQLLRFMVETRRAGKRLDGHSAGAADSKLRAYVSTGVSSCHEPTTAEEAVERLRLGLFVMIREGETRRELEGVAPLKDLRIDLRNLGLCTDGLGPRELITSGYMQSVVQKAIDLGFGPVQAVRMATLNTARHFGLDDRVGGIAPGKSADIVIIPDLRTVKSEYVISGGRVVARNGELLVAPRKHLFSRSRGNRVHLDRTVTEADFAVPVQGDVASVRVRVIDQVTELLTRDVVLELPVVGGEVQVDVGRDVIKVAAIERVRGTGERFVGFIRGTGMKRGAIATTVVWDAYDVIAAGVSEADMALAVNRLRETGGGIVVCAGGQILAEISMPISGTLSLEPVDAIARGLDGIQSAGESLGCTSPDIRRSLCVLTTGAIPFLRLCEHGMVDLRQNRFVRLFPRDT